MEQLMNPTHIEATGRPVVARSAHDPQTSEQES